MLPLARSLFALGALLALGPQLAAAAKVTGIRYPVGSPCTGYLWELPDIPRGPGVPFPVLSNDIMEIKYQFSTTSPPTTHDLIDYCKKSGGELRSVRVEACNISNSTTMELFGPELRPLANARMSPIQVECRSSNDNKCSLTFNILQKCLL